MGGQSLEEKVYVIIDVHVGMYIRTCLERGVRYVATCLQTHSHIPHIIAVIVYVYRNGIL
mgnify:CR=1 FL=1